MCMKNVLEDRTVNAHMHVHAETVTNRRKYLVMYK